MADIILTWPKKRSLESYVTEVQKAVKSGEVVCFSVAAKPNCERGDRTYMVHDGAIRGWLTVVGVTGGDEVDVKDPLTGRLMDVSKWLIVRYPEWHPLESPIPMKGFRGFRYAAKHVEGTNC